MGSNGGSAGGGVASDMVSMAAGMKMAGAMMGQLDNMIGNIGQTVEQSSPAPEKKETVIKCEKCGADLPQNAKFCLECGEKVKPAVPDGMVVCPGG